MTESTFFFIFAAIALASGLMVVFSRNAVNSAMFLIVTFLGMASLFVLLESYFLAVIQVLVYAGAVVVLFLFIVMLLDVKSDEKRKFGLITTIASVIGAAILGTGALAVVSGVSREVPEVEPTGATLKSFGNELFTTYLLPMQVTGFLLLIAMIGVIVLSKKAKAE